MEKLELTILKNLIHDEDYSRKVIPFIKLEYFDSRAEEILCQEIIDFIAKYNSMVKSIMWMIGDQVILQKKKSFLRERKKLNETRYGSELILDNPLINI